MLNEIQEVVTETPAIEAPTTETTSELTDDVKSKVIASLTEEDYCFNPYSNGSSFFIGSRLFQQTSESRVSILILMDLPFL